jgi:TonB family protein
MTKYLILFGLMLFSMATIAQVDSNKYDVIKRPNNEPTETVAPDGTVIKTYKTPEVMPEFPGGQTGMFKYLATIKYPPFARENDLEGTSFIMFVVNEQGKVVEPSVARSSGHGILDTASLDLIKAMPKWTPGKQDGKPVRVQYVVPLKFKLSGGPNRPKHSDHPQELFAYIPSEKW